MDLSNYSSSDDSWIFLESFLANIAGRLASEAVIKGAPKLKQKLAERHYASRWKNPWYRYLMFDNIALVVMSTLYGWGFLSWIMGNYPFDTLSVIATIIGVPLFFFLIRNRIIDKENYEISSFMDAIKNGKLVSLGPQS